MIRCFEKQINMSRIPDRGGEPVLEDSFGLAPAEAGHHQDMDIGEYSSQTNGLFDARDAKPLCLTILLCHSKGPGAAFQTMAVGVRLNDGQERRVGSGKMLEHLVIAKQAAARDFSPYGSRVGSG